MYRISNEKLQENVKENKLSGFDLKFGLLNCKTIMCSHLSIYVCIVHSLRNRKR